MLIPSSLCHSDKDERDLRLLQANRAEFGLAGGAPQHGRWQLSASPALQKEGDPWQVAPLDKAGLPA
jgi:hypothetical protein